MITTVKSIGTGGMFFCHICTVLTWSLEIKIKFHMYLTTRRLNKT